MWLRRHEEQTTCSNKSCIIFIVCHCFFISLLLYNYRYYFTTHFFKTFEQQIVRTSLLRYSMRKRMVEIRRRPTWCYCQHHQPHDATTTVLTKVRAILLLPLAPTNATATICAAGYTTTTRMNTNVGLPCGRSSRFCRAQVQRAGQCLPASSS